MKSRYLISLVVFLGVVVLFFFPEPETNFLAYSGTALFFVILIIFLIRNDKKRLSK